MEHDEVMSPTISMEGTLLTAVIEIQEGQDSATCDIPNALPRLMWKRRTKMEIDHHEDKGSLCRHPL